MKQCSKCKEGKDESEFNKDKRNKTDGLQSKCKKCDKEIYEKNKETKKGQRRKRYILNKEKEDQRNKKYIENNKEGKRQKDKEYRENNKEGKKLKNKEYRENNKEYTKQYLKVGKENNKEWDKQNNQNYFVSPLEYNSSSQMRKEIGLYEEIRESKNGNIECRCAYDGDGFEPTKRQIQKRLDAINGRSEGENRLYCSDKCKEDCNIYKQHKYPKYYKPYLSREVQPELSAMVLERDEYTCIKCQRHQNEIEVHCHHIEGIHGNPTESADMDTCVTLCKDCHKEAHNQSGCTYREMQCPPY